MARLPSFAPPSRVPDVLRPGGGSWNFYNVAEYGVVPGEDCYAPLTALLTRVVNKGAELFFPVPANGGDYFTSQPINLLQGSHDYMTIRGGGAGLYRANPGAPGVYGGAAIRRTYDGPIFNVAARYARITNLGFDGDRASGRLGDLINLSSTQSVFIDHCGFVGLDKYAITFSGGNAISSRISNCIFSTGLPLATAAVKFPDNYNGTLLQNGDYSIIDSHAYGGFALVEIGDTINLNITGCTMGGVVTGPGHYSGKVAFVGNRMAVGTMVVHGTDHTFVGNQISGAGSLTFDTDAIRCVAIGNVFSGGKTLIDLGVSNRMMDYGYFGGGWNSFTPTVEQGVAITAGTVLGRWINAVPATVHVKGLLGFSSAGTAASAIEVTLPSTLPGFDTTSASWPLGTFQFFDSGTAVYSGVAVATGTNRKVRFYRDNTGNYLGTGGGGGPTIASGDSLSFDLTYEID